MEDALADSCIDLLFIRPGPEEDWIAGKLSQYVDDLLEECAQNGVRYKVVEDLKYENANVASVSERIGGAQGSDRSVVGLFGHGKDAVFFGFEGDVLLDADNAKMLEGFHVYAVTCANASDFGQLLVSEGALSYVGYLEYFMIPKVGDECEPDDCWRDIVLGGLRQALSAGSYGVFEVYSAIQAEYSRWMERLSSETELEVAEEPGVYDLASLGLLADDPTLWNLFWLSDNQGRLEKLPISS